MLVRCILIYYQKDDKGNFYENKVNYQNLAELEEEQENADAKEKQNQPKKVVVKLHEKCFIFRISIKLMLLLKD